MNILFVIDKLGYSENTGIAHLSSIAKKEGHKTFFYSLDNLLLVDYVKKTKPDIIAYSCDSLSFNSTVMENKILKNSYDFVSIMGGPHPTFDPESFNTSGMDAYCIGEGEYAFKEFLQHVENNQSFDNIQNLITNKKNNPIRPLITNLDELPMPDHDLILGNTFLGLTSKKSFLTSRGCPFNCSYCCNNVYKKIYKNKGRYVRRFSVDYKINEIKYVKNKYRTDFIKLDDDCFCFKIDDWLKDFLNRYEQEIDVPFNCILRFDMVNDEMLTLLKNAGCYSVHLSIDSLNPDIRKNILHRNMNIDNDMMKNILKKIRKHGINTFVNFMLGIPTSSIQDEIDTIKFSNDSDITYPAYTMTVPFYGTELYKFCVKNGFINTDYKHGDFYGYTSLNGFSMEQTIIQHNIFFLGSLLSKIDKKYLEFFIPMIYEYNEKLYKDIWKKFYEFNIKNEIYKITD